MELHAEVECAAQRIGVVVKLRIPVLERRPHCQVVTAEIYTQELPVIPDLKCLEAYEIGFLHPE